MSEPTPIQTVNVLKQAHAGRVLAAVQAVITEINSEPELWFGGIPPSYDEVQRFLTHRSENIREVFDLPTEGEGE